MRARPFHAEGPRYRASVVLVPDLWVGPEAYQRFATFLGHRGWEGRIADFADSAGGLADRAAGLADLIRRQDVPTVVLAHGAAAILALAARDDPSVAAVVLMAPLVARGAVVRRLIYRPDTLWALATGRPAYAPHRGAIATAWLDDLSPGERAGILKVCRGEPARALIDVARGRGVRAGLAPRPTLYLHGAADRLTASSEAERMANELCAVIEVLPGTGRWLPCGGGWQACAAAVHRWLVRTLGESLLELHAEAMADRDAETDE